MTAVGEDVVEVGGQRRFLLTESDGADVFSISSRKHTVRGLDSGTRILLA